MIKSITFTGKSGYITEKIPEPHLAVRGYNGENENKRWFSDDDRKKIAEWKEEMKEWESHKDEYLHPQLVNNLLNRKIDFEAEKINLIFGANASGKTTILKAIAGNAGTTDGYPILHGPLDIKYKLGEDLTKEDIREYLDKKMKNSAVIDWDGAPVYYDNFCNRENHGSIGDMLGSVLGNDIGTELTYLMSKNHISQGQNSIYLLKRLMDIAKQHLCYADIFNEYVYQDGKFKEDMGVNDRWADAYRKQLEYFLGFEKSLVKSPGTFLFDELDKSLDVANIYALYTDVLPSLVKETGIQIIIISHSPLVLSDKIRNNEFYNFISMDEAYTENCIINLKKLF